MDTIERKLNGFGLSIPDPPKIPPNIETPYVSRLPAWYIGQPQTPTWYIGFSNRLVQVRSMVGTIPTFTQTTNVINGFSDLILRLYGSEIGTHARSAIGVQALPLGLPVILEALAEIQNIEVAEEKKG